MSTQSFNILAITIYYDLFVSYATDIRNYVFVNPQYPLGNPINRISDIKSFNKIRVLEIGIKPEYFKFKNLVAGESEFRFLSNFYCESSPEYGGNFIPDPLTNIDYVAKLTKDNPVVDFGNGVIADTILIPPVINCEIDSNPPINNSVDSFSMKFFIKYNQNY